MDTEVPEDEIVHRFERGPRDPAVVPADLNMHAGDLTDQARTHRLADIGEVWRPTAVLIYGELEAATLRQLNEFPAVVEVLDERLLRQDVLVRVQRAPHEVEADVRVGSEIENAHIRIAQQGVEIVGDARVREMGVASRPGALEIARADGDHVQAVTRVGVEMRAADAACADERNRRAAIRAASADDREGPALRSRPRPWRPKHSRLPMAPQPAPLPSPSWQQSQCAMLASGKRRGVDDTLSGAAKRRIQRPLEWQIALLAME